MIIIWLKSAFCWKQQELQQQQQQQQQQHWSHGETLYSRSKEINNLIKYVKMHVSSFSPTFPETQLDKDSFNLVKLHDDDDEDDDDGDDDDDDDNRHSKWHRPNNSVQELSMAPS